MHRDQVLQILRDHETELKAAGLLHLRLFGSVARGKETSTSDVDLSAEYDDRLQISLLTLAHTRNQLTDLLGTDVHLSSFKAMYPDIKEQAMQEAVLAF